MINKKSLLLLLILIVIGKAMSQTSFDVNLTIFGEYCSDGIQNQDETGIDCGGICLACPPVETANVQGTSSGGQRASGSFSSTFLIVSANSTIREQINVTGLAIYMVEISFVKPRVNTSINIEKKESEWNLPDEYQYDKVSGMGFQTSDINRTNIYFRVPIAWIEGQGRDYESFNLLNLRDEWKSWPTEFIGNDSEYLYFKASGRTLGIFAIIGKEYEPSGPIVLEGRNLPSTQMPGLLLIADGEQADNFLLFILCSIVITLLSGLFLHFFVRWLHLSHNQK